MTVQKSELEKRRIIRLSNKEANMMTKTCLQTALLELLEQKNMNDITVSELARKAGVSRTAFYSNYQTINDVFFEVIDETLSALNDEIWKAVNNQEDMFYPIVRKIYDKFDIYSLVLKADIEKTAFLQLRDYIRKTYPDISSETYYMIIAVISSLKGILIEWFLTDCRESVETIAELCDHVTKDIKEEILQELAPDRH